MNKECGRLNPVSIGQGRRLPKPFRMIPHSSQLLVRHIIISNIREQIVPNIVGDTPLRHGVADDPIGHKTAVRAAAYPYPASVQIRIAPYCLIRKVHEVVKVHRTIFPLEIRKGVALAAAAPGIAVAHEISPGRPKLHLMVEAGTKDHLGPAVDVQDPRIGLSRMIIHRF